MKSRAELERGLKTVDKVEQSFPNSPFVQHVAKWARGVLNEQLTAVAIQEATEEAVRQWQIEHDDEDESDLFGILADRWVERTLDIGRFPDYLRPQAAKAAEGALQFIKDSGFEIVPAGTDAVRRAHDAIDRYFECNQDDDDPDDTIFNSLTDALLKAEDAREEAVERIRA